MVCLLVRKLGGRTGDSNPAREQKPGDRFIDTPRQSRHLPAHQNVRDKWFTGDPGQSRARFPGLDGQPSLHRCMIAATQIGLHCSAVQCIASQCNALHRSAMHCTATLQRQRGPRRLLAAGTSARLIAGPAAPSPWTPGPRGAGPRRRAQRAGGCVRPGQKVLSAAQPLCQPPAGGVPRASLQHALIASEQVAAQTCRLRRAVSKKHCWPGDEAPSEVRTPHRRP